MVIRPMEMSEEDYRRAFASRFRKWLKRTETTEKEVAEALGVTCSAVYHWASGENLPNLFKWERLLVFIRKRERQLKEEGLK